MIGLRAARGVRGLAAAAAFFFLGSGLAAQSDPASGFIWLDFALAGTGAPDVSAVGALRDGGQVTFTVKGGKPGEYCALLFSDEAVVPGATVQGGKYVLGTQLAAYGIPLNGQGAGARTFTVFDPPNTVYAQAVMVDAFGKLRLSNGIGSNRGHQWVVDDAPITWSPRQGTSVAVLADRLYLIGGRSSGFTPYNDVHSFDGNKWSQVQGNAPATTSRFSPRWEASVASHAGRLWVGLGATAILDYALDLWSSTDGKVWTLESSNVTHAGGPGPLRNARAISFNGKLWILGGYYKFSSTQKPTSYYTNEVWSYDTVTDVWKRHVAPWHPREDVAATVHNGRLYVVGGSSVLSDAVPIAYVKFSDVWSTADGVSWKLETSDGGFLPMGDHVCESFRGELQLFGGVGNTYNYQWRSDKGGNWTVPLELGGPGYSFGNQPIASAAKDAMPDIVRYDSVGAVLGGRLWSIAGFGVNTPYNQVVVTD